MKKNLNSLIKKIPGMKIIIENFYFRKEFLNDFSFFKKNYMYANQSANSICYDMMLIIHSLEKAMCNKNPKFFGIEKTKKLMTLIEKYESLEQDIDRFEYVYAINVLRDYVKFYEIRKWVDRKEYQIVKEFCKKYSEIKNIESGTKIIKKSQTLKKCMIDYQSFLESRHAIRSYLSKKISDADLRKAVEIAINTPSACNRQMTKIYYIEDSQKKKAIEKYAQGLSNFNLENANYFVITFDISSCYFVGERNQGWLNAGLLTMNFVNALHSLGIGSCFVQFGNTFLEEQKLKKILNINESERIAIILVAGYYEEEAIVPQSIRKSINDMFKIIN